jgi:hypothetical protein
MSAAPAAIGSHGAFRVPLLMAFSAVDRRAASEWSRERRGFRAMTR